MDALSLFIVVIAMSSIWVALDAHNLHVKKGRTTGLLDIGVAGWFFACLFLWLLAFPVYLVNREKLRIINAPPTPVPPAQRNLNDAELQIAADRRAEESLNAPPPAKNQPSPETIASRPSTLLRDLLAAQQDTAATLHQIRNAIAFAIILWAITALIRALP